MIDLLWAQERATSEAECLDSPLDTPLLEEGTALDERVRELLQESSRAPAKSDPGVGRRAVVLPQPVAPRSDGGSRPSLPSLYEVSEPRPRSSVPPSLFAPVTLPKTPVTGLFDTYDRRPRTPASGTFLAAREMTPVAKSTAPPTPARVAATHFETGWHLLREGRADETLSEWETALELDPNNRSYAVNVQKLRLKLQR